MMSSSQPICVYDSKKHEETNSIQIYNNVNISNLASNKQLLNYKKSFKPNVQILLNIFTKQNVSGFNVVHLNIQSMHAHIDELRCDLAPLNIEAVLLSETWLKTSHSANMIKVEGYNIFRCDRRVVLNNGDVKRGGGVAILLKKSYKSKILSTSENIREHSCEFMFLEVSSGGRKLLLGCVYKPNRCTDLCDLYEKLEVLCPLYNIVLIGGDFNLNLLDSDRLVTDFKTKTNIFNLKFINIDCTTHLNSLIDHFLVCDLNHVIKYHQIQAPAYSKHDLLYVCIDFTQSTTAEETSVTFRNFKNIDNSHLQTDLSNVDWNSILMLPIEDCISGFSQIFHNLLNKHAPLMTKIILNKINPWMTTQIMNLRIRRDSAYKVWKRNRHSSRSSVLYSNFTAIRNQLTTLIRITKKNYYSPKLDLSLSSKVLWKNLRSIGVGDKCEDKSDILPNILKESFFPINSSESSRNIVPERSAPAFNFHAVTTSDVIIAMYSIKSSAVGLDEICPRFLKLILPYSINFLTDLVNRCLSESVFPEAWKVAKVIPVAKKSGGFRPISLLPYLSKIMEKVMASQINGFVTTNNLMNELQSGFRKSHSCKTAVLKVVDDLTNIADSRQIAALVLIDFTKAFDTVNHDVLIKKLKSRFGFDDCAIDLMKCYLHDRKSVIYSCNEWSDYVSINSGVPQGSILGPLLYCLYVDDITSCFKKLSVHCYADDTQLYIGFKKTSICEAISDINLEREILNTGAKNNYLHINASKSQCVLISYLNLDISALPPVTLDGNIIEYVTKVNNLGYIINNKLKWNDLVNKSCKSIFYGLRCLWNCANVLSSEVRSRIVQSLLGHHIFLSDVVIGNLDSMNKANLQKAFNAMTRFVFGLRRFDHISHLNDKIFGFTLDKLLIFKRQIFLFNLIQSKEPRYLFDKIKFFQSRRCDKVIILPSFNYSRTRNTFFINDIIFWNTLPNNIKNCRTLNEFKHKLTIFLN